MHQAAKAAKKVAVINHHERHGNASRRIDRKALENELGTSQLWARPVANKGNNVCPLRTLASI
jgi:hypothetical protein